MVAVQCRAEKNNRSRRRRFSSLHQYGKNPFVFTFSLYTDVVAVMYNVFKSESPQVRFAGCSGKTIVPK